MASSGDATAVRIRQIGAWLNENGGKPAMLDAHEQFAGRSSRGARNLEMMWDGIGTWQG